MKKLLVILLLTLWTVCINAQSFKGGSCIDDTLVVLHENICSGQSYTYKGKTYKSSRIIVDSLKTVNNCDSVIYIDLKVRPTYTFTTYDTICTGYSYKWRGQILTQSGTYRENLTSIYGCDSTYILHLLVRSVVNINFTKTILLGDTFYFRNRIYTRDGIYKDTALASFGCDTIFTFRVRVADHVRIFLTDSTCSNEPYIWGGKKLTQPGTYRDTLPGFNGDLDTFRTLVLNVLPISTTTLRQALCDGRSFYYRGRLISSPGIYYDTLVSMNGCDSIIRMVVNHFPSYVTSDTVWLCAGDTNHFHSHIITTAGIYKDTLPTISGCDSIFIRTVLMQESNTIDTYVHRCDHQPYNFLGQSITVPGTYYAYYKNIFGCDSIHILHYDTTPFYFEEYATICEGETYDFHGTEVSLPGVHFAKFKTPFGCDSTYKLTLTIGHKHIFTTDTTACDDVPFFWHGKQYTESGTYSDTIFNKEGCPDIYILNFTINPTYITSTNYRICPNAGFWYKNTFIDKPGIYYDTLKTGVGCDSIIRLIVDRSPSFFISDTATIYQGATYNFRGRLLRQAGIYQDSLVTQYGCDSIFQLVLHVTPAFYKLEYATICDNEYYDFNGRKLNKPGIYFDSLKTHNLFDSVYELHLSVLPTYFFSVRHSVCYGNSIHFRGKHITKPGIYYDSLYTINGCDSIYQLIFNWSNSYMFEDTARICYGDYHVFRGRVVSSPGLYYDSLQTKTGCDSIYKLVLYVKNHFYKEINDTLCEGDVYDFHGRKLTEAGVYYDSIKTPEGCDSIYKLTLSKYPQYLFTSYIEECSGHRWKFREHYIDKPGVYYDSLVSSNGCDSVYKLVYSWSASYHFYDSATICVGDNYNFRGRVLTNAGTYFDSLRTIKGCDSIYEFHLNVMQVFHDVQTVHICSNEYYNFRGRSLNKSGIYFDSLKSSKGCDSIYELRLTILPEYLITQYIEFCQGTSFKYKDTYITKPGVFYDTLKTTAGCDSVYKIIFNWAPTYLISDTVNLCDGATYNFRGRIISNSGIYYDSLKTTERGCDSIFQLVAQVAHGFYHEDTITICSNEVYYFHGRRITQSGIYWDSLTTTAGCDSIYKHYIFVNSSKLTTINVDRCTNDVYYKADGTRLNKSGVYYDTLVTSRGCDSIVKIILNVHADQLHEESRTICRGSYITWHGRNLTKAGIYWDSLTSKYGCDSLFKLTLTNNTYYTEIDTTICNNTHLRFNNKIYTATGIYYDTLTSSIGCDSIFKIDLTVNPTYNIIRHLTICDTDNPVPFGSGFVNKTGVYTDTTTTRTGCDSINTLYLTVVQTHYFEDDTICEDGVYSWRGHQLTQPGLYTDTLRDQTEGHCDIIFTLRLRTVQKTHFYGADLAPYICADDIEFSITPRYTGSKPEAYTIKYTSANISKQSDIINADFTNSPILIPMPLASNGDSLRPDTYTGTIELYNRICDANPQSLNFTLNIRYPNYIVQQHWNDVVAILNSTYNGGYTFSKYEWYVNEILIQSMTGSNLYLPTLRTGDKIEVGLTREGENYAVLSCPIWMQDLSNMEVSEYPVTIEGTILRNNTQARIYATSSGNYSLYTATGIMISTGSFTTDSETLITLPSVAGIYFLKVISENEPKTFKIIVQ